MKIIHRKSIVVKNGKFKDMIINLNLKNEKKLNIKNHTNSGKKHTYEDMFLENNFKSISKIYECKENKYGEYRFLISRIQIILNCKNDKLENSKILNFYKIHILLKLSDALYISLLKNNNVISSFNQFIDDIIFYDDFYIWKFDANLHVWDPRI